MALRYRSVPSLALAATLACAAVLACAPPQASAQSDERSYVMLLNGNVFHGVAKPLGDKIEIRISDGNAIHIDSKQIALIAPTKLALYERQVKGSSRLGAAEHWYLTQWCIQEGLVDQAIHHFEVLSSMVEQNDKYKQLEHKLKEAIFNSEKVRSLLGDKHPSYHRNAGSPASAEELASGVPASATGVVQASASLPVRSLNAEQQLLLNSMPSYVKKSFQSHIAPLLVSRCGQAGCHGLPGGETDFHIRQAVGDQAASVVASNLENVIRYVNPQSPAESDLVAYATKAHGTQSKPRFQPHGRDDDHRHIERITQWIKSLSLATPAGANNLALALPPNVMPASINMHPSSNALLAVPQHASLAADGVVNAIDVRSASAMTGGAMTASAMTGGGVTSAVTTASNLPAGDSVDEVAELDGRGAKIREWRDFAVEEDRDAKLSKAPKTAAAPPVLTFEELKEIEDAIEKLEQKQAKKVARDPFDPNYFNQTYGGK